MKHTAASNASATPLPVFPAGIDAHWETENRRVWNAQQGAAEEQELVYEVTWVAELGVWRRFLKSQRRVQG